MQSLFESPKKAQYKAQFNAAYAMLNPQQKQAVDTIEGPVMVVAGPGTGKTQILTTRIANILQKTQVDPSNIVALTFTEAAATNMRKRLAKMIGPAAYEVVIATFHGFAQRIMRSHREQFGLLLSAEPITAHDQIKIIRDAIDQYTGEYFSSEYDPYYFAKQVLNTVLKLKQEAWSVEEFKNLIIQKEEEFENAEDKFYEKGAHKGKIKKLYRELQTQIEKNKDIAWFYQQYEDALQKTGQCDFADMLLKTIEVLEQNENVRLDVQEQYLYMLIDEHQDTNHAQNKLAQLVMSYHESPNMFVVGDEKQSIFRFQGANVENFYALKTAYPSLQVIHLQTNYRSTQQVLDQAEELIPSKESPLQAFSKEASQGLQIHTHETPQSEHAWLVKQIETKIQNNINPQEIAILVRQNNELEEIAALLKAHNIPHSIVAKAGLFEEQIVKDILVLFDAIQNTHINESAAKALLIPWFVQSTVDAAALIAIAGKKKKQTLFQTLQDEKSHSAIILQKNTKPKQVAQQLIDFADIARDQGIHAVFTAIIHQTNLIQWATQKGIQNKIFTTLSFFENYIKVIQKNNADISLHDFLQEIELAQVHSIAPEIKRTHTKNTVALMTAHNSKGLEFEYVYIPHCAAGNWGGRKNKKELLFDEVFLRYAKQLPGDEQASTEDEKRLLYVALTRAKKECIISYASMREDQKEQLPSPFLSVFENKEVEHIVHEAEEAQIPTKSFWMVEDKKQEFINYIAQQLEARPLSASGLNAFIDCPWNFVIGHLLRTPQQASFALQFGSAMHGVAEYIVEEWLQNKTIPQKELIEKFFTNELYKQDMHPHDEQRAYKRGRGIHDWIEWSKIHWHQHMQVEQFMRAPFVQVGMQTISIHGKLDRIENLPNGSLRVLDYKTGKHKTRNHMLGNTKTSSGSQFRQLVFYKYLIEESKSGFANVSEGVIEFLEPNEKGDFKRELFELNTQHVQELKEQIEQLYSVIQNGEFLTIDPKDKNCVFPDIASSIVRGLS